MLVLPIKKKWFDMILAGVKKEEYREVTKYWATRFSKIFPIDMQFSNLLTAMYPYSFIPSGGVSRTILFRNGYSKNSPSFKAVCTLEDIRTGNTDWGAEQGKEYYVLRILKIEE